jgi:hypothetical protein
MTNAVVNPQALVVVSQDQMLEKLQESEVSGKVLAICSAKSKTIVLTMF